MDYQINGNKCRLGKKFFNNGFLLFLTCVMRRSDFEISFDLKSYL